VSVLHGDCVAIIGHFGASDTALSRARFHVEAQVGPAVCTTSPTVNPWWSQGGSKSGRGVSAGSVQRPQVSHRRRSGYPYGCRARPYRFGRFRSVSTRASATWRLYGDCGRPLWPLAAAPGEPLSRRQKPQGAALLPVDHLVRLDRRQLPLALELRHALPGQPRTAANCSRLTYSITPRLRPWTPSIIPANVAP
jgi:hypothetical protein